MKIPSKNEVCDYTTEQDDKMETQRDGSLSDIDHRWNRTHGLRNYHVVKAILEYARKHSLESLVVVNMSGMNEGKPDPVLVDLIQPSFQRGCLSWFVVDHPDSLTFSDTHIQQWIQDRGITCIAYDHRQASGPAEMPRADIVLCTEIVEHLDYSDMINLLRWCRSVLKPGGLLILTTPNAIFLGYRVLFALGRWDSLHFDDEPDHVDQGLVGHTIYYDGARLKRVLNALQFSHISFGTFNVGHGPGEYRNLLTRLAAMTLRGLSYLIPDSGQVLYVLAERPLDEELN